MPLTLAQRLIHRFGATDFGSWLFAHVLHRADRIVWKLSRRNFTLTSALSGLPIIVLTTTGAKSGVRRTVPLVALASPRKPGDYAVVASNFGQHNLPGWYFNLRKTPRADGMVYGLPHAFIARELTGADYERVWGQAERCYAGYARYKQRASNRHIPIMLLELVDEV